MKSFVELCCNGCVELEDIDYFVDIWYNSYNNEELYEFLGMTENEYTIWLKDSEILKFIVKAHKEGITLDSVLLKEK